MARYTMGEVEIEGAYPVEEILELSMDVGANRHGYLTYGGLVPEADAKRFVQQNADRQTVKMYLRDELEFCGYPQDISVEHYTGRYYLRVTLVSSSQLMDIDPRDRFFQDISHTFADIIAEAYDDSKTGNLTVICGKEQIKNPILQYRETDWQFTLRMASRLSTVVIPNVASEEPQVSLGLPNRQPHEEINNISYRVGRDAAGFRRKCAEGKDAGYQNFLRYEMKSDNRYKLGDSVIADGTVLAVMRKSLAYEQSEIQETYILGHEQDFAVALRHNKRITGLELEGKVLERRGQEMQILLDIDERRKDCGKTWFSYAPATNNAMYSMPLKDEKVMLQWQSENDNDALIVRPDRKNSQDMQNPGERHFLTEHESHLMMAQNKISCTNPVGNMEWLADKGFNLSTGKTVSISAQKDIIIKSQAQAQIYSPERITACKAGVESSIDMFSNELHLKAVKKVAITSKADDYKKTTLPERSPSFPASAPKAAKLAAAVPVKSSVQASGLTPPSATPPSAAPDNYSERKVNLPKSNGRWSGEPGNSVWIPDSASTPSPKNKATKYNNPQEKTFGEILDSYSKTHGTPINGIVFRDRYPDFSVVSKGNVEIDGFSSSGGRSDNFDKADIAMAEQRGCTPAEVAEWRKSKGYTWHECEDMKSMQKIPHEIHANIPHSGGFAKAKAKERENAQQLTKG